MCDYMSVYCLYSLLMYLPCTALMNLFKVLVDPWVVFHVCNCVEDGMFVTYASLESLACGYSSSFVLIVSFDVAFS